MAIIYIAGPFADPDLVFGVTENVARAAKVARACMRKGWTFFCPHTHTNGFQHYPEFTDEQWYRFNLDFLERCDAIIMMDGWEYSKGASLELKHARDRGIPIFYENDGIPDAPE